MEFWGVEVKPGVPHKVTFKEDRLLHLSQAALGETKKGNENVVLFVSFEGKKLALGTLSLDKCPQMTYDLIFEKEFELSHNSKNRSVYFTGYKSKMGSDSPPSDDSQDSDSEEEILLVGKPEPIEGVKVSSSAAKPKVKIVEPKMDDESEDDDSEDSSDEGESDEEDNTGASDGTDDDDDSDDDEDDSDDEDTQDNSKKRPAETSASKTPADKKAKLSTPQKSGADGKQGKGGHAATPHPAKKAGKSDKSKQEPPKSAATPVSCNTCRKTFNSEKGLESHNKAKHSN